MKTETRYVVSRYTLDVKTRERFSGSTEIMALFRQVVINDSIVTGQVVAYFDFDSEAALFKSYLEELQGIKK